MIRLADMKKHLKAEDHTADDDLIVEIEQAAVAFIQNETGRFFGGIGEITEVVSANGWASIWLQAEPIMDDPDYMPFTLERRVLGSGWGAVGATEFEVDGYRLYPLTYWTPGHRTLRATYWAGYDEGAEPADVQQAVKELATRMYERRSAMVEGSVSEMPFSVRDVIRAHRVVVV